MSDDPKKKVPDQKNSEQKNWQKIDWAFQIRYFAVMLIGIVAVLVLLRSLGLRG